jgi:hypothetical protein
MTVSRQRVDRNGLLSVPLDALVAGEPCHLKHKKQLKGGTHGWSKIHGALPSSD